MRKSSLLFLCTGLLWFGATTELLAQSARVSGRGVRVQVGNRSYTGGGYPYNRYDYRGNHPYRGTQIIIRTGDDDCYDSYSRRDRYYYQDDNYPNTYYPDSYYQRYRDYYR